MAKSRVNRSTFPLLIFFVFSLSATTIYSSSRSSILRDTKDGTRSSDPIPAFRWPAASVGDGDGDDDGDDEYTCVYTIYVRTGSIWKGGTDSVIGVTLVGADGWGVAIPDLVAWGGLMEPGHNYFERKNLDIFSGRGPCLSSWPPCWMNLTSDGSGPHHGWYCNYAEVTVTGPHMGCAQELFTVEQWLATDTAPWQLYAVRDQCPSDVASVRRLPKSAPTAAEGR